MSQSVGIVMAAGKGVRMQSELPKVLTPVLGRPMIDYVLDTLFEAGVDRAIVVVGYRADDVKRALAGRSNVAFALQTEQLGTGHAVMQCREALALHDGPVVVVAGDSPMLLPASLRSLLAEYERGRPACILGTGYKDPPDGLGRIARDAAGNFVAIVEQKDATPAQRKITEVNLSCYIFNNPDLWQALGQLRADNASREYYLTDCPAILKEAGREVRAMPILRPREALSINTPEELAAVETALRRNS